MKRRRNLIVAIVLSAAAGLLTVKNVSTPVDVEKVNTSNVSVTETTSTDSPSNSNIPSHTPTYEGCGYMWAYHEDPELSIKINKEVQALEPLASAKVRLFGEDCIYADGHSTFSVMETDFYIRLPISDTTTEEHLGNWMKQVITIILSLSEEEVQGKKGFTEFFFIKNENKNITIRVGTSEYLNNASDISDEEFFEKFYTPLPPPITPIPIIPTP